MTTAFPVRPEPILKPPRLALSLLLSFLLPGSGFTYLDRPWMHLAWMAANGVLSSALFVAALATSQPGLLAIPLLLLMAMLVHNTLLFRAQRIQPSRRIDNGLKSGLIAAHFGVVFLLIVPIAAAVILPNLLGAQQRAQAAVQGAYLRQVEVQVATLRIEDEARKVDGPCTDIPGVQPLPNGVRSCTVQVTDDQPQVTLVTDRGAVLTRP